MEEKKRKFSAEDDSDRNMMMLLKRLHLDKTSELYEKVPLFEKRPVVNRVNKRWRLSPIREHEHSRGVKRRRVDSEMAEHMNASLWISDDHIQKDKKPSIVADTQVNRTESAAAPAQQINVNIDLGARHLSLDEKFIRRQVREQNMQLVLWRPPLLDTLLQQQEEGEEWEMC